jgi:hypothetical protein
VAIEGPAAAVLREHVHGESTKAGMHLVGARRGWPVLDQFLHSPLVRPLASLASGWGSALRHAPVGSEGMQADSNN